MAKKKEKNGMRRKTMKSVFSVSQWLLLGSMGKLYLGVAPILRQMADVWQPCYSLTIGYLSFPYPENKGYCLSYKEAPIWIIRILIASWTHTFCSSEREQAIASIIKYVPETVPMPSINVRMLCRHN